MFKKRGRVVIMIFVCLAFLSLASCGGGGGGGGGGGEVPTAAVWDNSRWDEVTWGP